MLKLIWLSDLHFASEGEVLGHNPRARLDAAIAHINAHHADAHYCVISGDLVERGEAGEYRSLKSRLDQLALPYLPLAGNHDERDALRSVLPVPDGGMPGFVQYSLAHEAGLIVCLDTQKTGSGSGEFCAARAAWLQALFNTARDTPLYLFLHHPPQPLGLPMQDQEIMQNGEAFLDLLHAHGNVRHLFIGHVHRPICGTMAGIPFATLRSALYQAPAPQPAWDWDSFAPAHEAPELGVITINRGDVTVQYHQFCDYATGT